MVQLGIGDEYRPDESDLYQLIEENEDTNGVTLTELNSEKYQKGEEISYGGNISTTVYEKNIKKTQRTTARWKEKDTPDIPNEELNLRVEEYDDFGYVLNRDESQKKNFSKDEKIQFLLTGEEKSISPEELQEDVIQASSSFKVTIDKIRGFFNRMISRDENIK